jgi:hypothetical protein
MAGKRAGLLENQELYQGHLLLSRGEMLNLR